MLNVVPVAAHPETAAKQVAQVLHPHFERENKLALPVIGVARELAEGKTSSHFSNAVELSDKFKLEYEKMLQEHIDIVKALEKLEKIAKKNKIRYVVYAKKLKLHAKI